MSKRLSVREAFAGKHLLVTGFTGFLAKVWVALILEHIPEIKKLTLLVRGRRTQKAADRVREVFETSPAMRRLREKYGDDLHAFLASRLDVVEGDVSESLMGIEPVTLDALAPQLDAIVHCAGLTDFSPDPLKAVSINVLGCIHAADVAARIPSKRIMHVSTCFVAGSVDGDIPEKIEVGRSPNGTEFNVEMEIRALRSACRAVDEREGGPRKPAARQGRIDVGSKRAQVLGWPNLYTYSKGLAEHALAARDDIDLTTVRPSVVECAREFPFPGWNEGLNTSGPIVWMVSGYAWKVPVRADIGFDVVPVDTVARGMTVATAALLQGEAKEFYQLASGDHNRFTFGRGLDLTALKVRRGYVPTGISGLERILLTHLDSTAAEHGADKSYFIPAAHRLTRWAKSMFKEFDSEKHLPGQVAKEKRDEIGEWVRDASLRLNKSSMLLKSIEQLWHAYQPFVHDFNYYFRTQNVRDASALLDDAERQAFGWNMETLDWRHYWMDVEIPGLDKWSLPLLRGKDAPIDPRKDLGGEIQTFSASRLQKKSKRSEGVSMMGAER